MTEEQLRKGNVLAQYLGWAKDKFEKLSQKNGKFEIDIDVSYGSSPEYIYVMDFLSDKDVEQIRKIILDCITKNIKETEEEFANL